MRSLTLLILLAVPALAQLMGPDGAPPRPPESCPLRSVNDGMLERISPDGHLVFRYKGELMVGKTTSETRYRIPGYSKRQLHAGQLVKLQPGTRAKMRICERTGEVVEMKILEMGKKPDDESSDDEQPQREASRQ